SMTISPEVTRTWFELPDGTRIDAKIVATDAEHDLSVLRPNEAGDVARLLAPAAVLPKGKSQPMQPLAQVIVLGQLPRDAGLEPTAHFARVAAVLRTPWTSYVLQAPLGSVVFAEDGSLLGMVVALPSGEAKTGMGGMMQVAGPMGGVAVALP